LIHFAASNLCLKNAVAHELRHAAQEGKMATKVKLMKLLQEIRGLAQVTNRRPPPRPSVLYLMQLRESAAQDQTPKRRLTVSTDSKENVTTPLPVKINHVKSDETAFPTVIN